MTPRILLSGCDENRILYENAVIQSGGTVQSHYCPPMDTSCDGLLLCGGNDISPWLYGQQINGSVKLDEKRDKIELELARRYIEAGKPVLGICRGMQMLNVVMGGDLIQDIGDPLHIFHSHWEEPMEKTHPICTAEGSILRALYGERMMVNSIHHQAVDHLGKGLKATAWTESGLVEAFQHESLPLLGVQFHPERMSFQRSRPDTVDGALIFRWLTSATGLLDK